jgi:dipeptidyl aminopeptidase/acylaminoacyl peptidase
MIGRFLYLIFFFSLVFALDEVQLNQLFRLNSFKVSENFENVLFSTFRFIENKSQFSLLMMNLKNLKTKSILNYSVKDAQWIHRDENVIFIYQNSIYLKKLSNNKISKIREFGSTKIKNLKVFEDFVYFISDNENLFSKEPKSNVKQFKSLPVFHWKNYFGTGKNILYKMKLNFKKAITIKFPVKLSQDYNVENYDIFKENNLFISRSNSNSKAWNIENNLYLNNKLIFKGGNIENAKFSPNGKKISFLQGERKNYESEKKNLFIYDIETKQINKYDHLIDHSIVEYIWGTESEIIFTVDQDGERKVYSLLNDEIKLIIKNGYNYNLQRNQMGFIFMRNDMSKPTGFIQLIYNLDLFIFDKFMRRITNLNVNLLKLPKMKKFYLKNKLQGFYLLPENWEISRNFPSIQLVHGGKSKKYLSVRTSHIMVESMELSMEPSFIFLKWIFCIWN